MKYERITSRNEEPFYAFDACKECEQKDVCDKWCTYTVGAYTRLHELEDKIERGELIERTSEEYSAVRKEAVIEFAVKLKKKADPYNYEEIYIDRSVMYTDIDDLVTEMCGE